MKPVAYLPRRDFLKTTTASLSGLCLMPDIAAFENKERIFRTIPSTGERIPAIGMGSWLTFDVGSSESERAPMRKVLRTFADLGGGVIDSSPMYGSSQKVIGALAEELGVKDKLWVATKVWTNGEQAGKSQIDESVSLFHKWPALEQVHNIRDSKTHIRTLRELKDKGKLKYVGVTHYVDAAHDELAKLIRSEPLDFIQINLSVRGTAAEDYLLPLAADKGVAVIINQPFETKALFRTVGGVPLPPWAGEWDMPNWASFFLKYIISNPHVSCTIPATTQVAHVKENMAAGYAPLPDALTRKKMTTYYNQHTQ
ncbi:diketogulonate reductase-like aldo/keto reductase [Catalinimonas alkaloidigena]|uniref:aldo/keto reductase n=1 Tax=Catalinimonas alkaloidigena TaxID=1075417 RepID=UPI0024068196|nr:aldo/keto reductase [Catalinimonas alkaloidigena]MDF9800757.1 diketogulonate reductase-like aldo/keto reductase [Catalinimonas alkaloidigena]